MKLTALRKFCRTALALLGAALVAVPVAAFPPALPHTFYGMVRDEQGNAIPAGAKITLETANGTKVYGVVSVVFEAGVNYRLTIPLDAGLGSASYKPTALNPAVAFKIKITIGDVTYLPIEMTHDFKLMGQPGKSTLLNLSLGEDSNGDGIPDAWQRRIDNDLSRTSPTGDYDNDGLSNWDEYLAGTYAYDSASGFTLDIARFIDDAPVVKFTAIHGRTYTVLGTADLENPVWSTVNFRLGASDANVFQAYAAYGVSIVEVIVVPAPEQPAPKFFKLMLQ
jgi:hypothetical protein